MGARYKLTIPAPALLGERMWQPAQSSAAYSSYEAFVDDCVPYLARELELVMSTVDKPPAVIQIDDPHLCLFVSDDVREKYPDPEAAAAFAVDKTNEMLSLAGLLGEGGDGGDEEYGAELCVHLCRRAGGKARGEHGHDGDLSRIVHHINNLKVRAR